MKSLSPTLAVLLALCLGTLSHPPPTPPSLSYAAAAGGAAPKAGTTLRPTGPTTPNYYYDEEDFNHAAAASPITDSPVAAHHVPSNIKPVIYGLECTIESAGYPGEFLRMSNGYVHYFPELKRGDPKPNGTGEWDWTGIWNINKLDMGRGETFYQFKSHESKTYLTYNATRYTFVRGVAKDYYLANLWEINTKVQGYGTTTNIQHSQHPNGFLHAMTHKKKETRSIGIMVAEPSKDIYHWKIACDHARQPVNTRG